MQQHGDQRAQRLPARKGGLLLDRQSGWLDGGDTGQTVVPGDVEGSLLIQAVRYGDEDIAMPPKYQLDTEVVALLEQWVKMGAPGPAKDIGETEFSQLGDQDAIFEKAKTHWAFQPVRAVEPPKADDPAWNEHPIDRFIWANLPYALQWNGGQRFAPRGYLTDYFADEAVEAIGQREHNALGLSIGIPRPDSCHSSAGWICGNKHS